LQLLHCSVLGLLGGEGSEELVLLGEGLEATVTKLGGGIDEFKVDVLVHPVLSAREDRLTEHNSALLGAHDLTLDEEVILINFTVVRETTQRSDVLLNSISRASSVILSTVNFTNTNVVDLLVDLGTGVVAALTDTANSPLNGSGVPSTDTTDLAETSVSLSLQLLDTVSVDDTFGTVTFGDTDSVDAFVFGEDFTDGNFLLEFAEAPVDFLGDVTTVDLDFHNVGFVLAEAEFTVLGGADHTDDGSVFLDAGEVTVD